MGSVLSYVLDNEIDIAAYLVSRQQLADNDHVATPPELPATWWLFTYTIAPIISRINITYEQLQDHLLTLGHQRDLITCLVSDLIIIFNVRDVEDDAGYHDVDIDNYMLRHGKWLTVDMLSDYMDDQGSRAQACCAKLIDEGQEDKVSYVLGELGKFVLDIIYALDSLQAERDDENGVAHQEAPHVLPLHLVQMRPKDFVSQVLAPRLAQLRASWSPRDIHAIEQQHRSLYQAYAAESPTTTAIDGHTLRTPFNEAWSTVGSVEVTLLRRFCGGVATVFPNTASVESDFSILKWEKDEFRTSLMDLSLEGIFQAKQFSILSKC